MLQEMVYIMFINFTTLITFAYFGGEIAKDVNIKSGNQMPFKLKALYGV
jgi:hypothetical protein